MRRREVANQAAADLPAARAAAVYVTCLCVWRLGFAANACHVRAGMCAWAPAPLLSVCSSGAWAIVLGVASDRSSSSFALAGLLLLLAAAGAASVPCWWCWCAAHGLDRLSLWHTLAHSGTRVVAVVVVVAASASCAADTIPLLAQVGLRFVGQCWSMGRARAGCTCIVFGGRRGCVLVCIEAPAAVFGISGGRLVLAACVAASWMCVCVCVCACWYASAAAGCVAKHGLPLAAPISCWLETLPDQQRTCRTRQSALGASTPAWAARLTRTCACTRVRQRPDGRGMRCGFLGDCAIATAPGIVCACACGHSDWLLLCCASVWAAIVCVYRRWQHACVRVVCWVGLALTWLHNAACRERLVVLVVPLRHSQVQHGLVG